MCNGEMFPGSYSAGATSGGETGRVALSQQDNIVIATTPSSCAMLLCKMPKFSCFIGQNA